MFYVRFGRYNRMWICPNGSVTVIRFILEDWCVKKGNTFPLSYEHTFDMAVFVNILLI